MPGEPEKLQYRTHKDIRMAGTFVGREKELEQLDSRLDLMMQGQGQVWTMPGMAADPALLLSLPDAHSSGTTTCLS